MSDEKKLNHLAIIMDGNGRWAQKRFLPRVMGHKQGMNNIEKIALAANDLGIKVLTLYAFSTENWGRPSDEVNYLMKLPIKFFDKFMPKLMANNVKVNIMGYTQELPQATLEVVQKAMDDTKNNTGMVLNFAFNYGARREITTAVKEIAQKVVSGDLSVNQINEDLISENLLTGNLPYPDPDLILRTSGEERISNFLLWQLAYSELAFSDKLWPDFNEDDLQRIVLDFKNRNRRFGKL
ncbi:isoprenyl transferase [Lactobacillus psittaci]|uniref:Isoprenyl transferase n=1 Tax=Lactobacillus psittaci DSM 15354 TaxID=1122152 RepID=A0A0R1S945_9LACO|nr:isoprenyl transferase [Lactobacillus psittaci]KRL64020.1 di-trans,poly-cis-decaprenylcistransferase [Lactobacillus psittaci DSM 15354]